LLCPWAMGKALNELASTFEWLRLVETGEGGELFANHILFSRTL